jgi:flagellar biosynthesis/type III secretory pathway protein FliH
MQREKFSIPHHRQKVRIIANPDLIQYELNAIRLEKERFEIKRDLERDTYADRRRKELQAELKGLGKYQEEEPEEVIERDPPTYYREMRFSNYDTPVELSLDKVEEDTISVDVAAREIQKAYENGLHDGQLTARATYKTELQKYRDWINRIDSVVENLTDKHQEEIKQMHSNLVELSVMIAEYILLEEINRDKSAVLRILKEAIQGLETEKVFSIYLHHDDLDIVRSTRGKLLKDLPDHLNISILPDSTLTVGSALMETSAGIVDTRIKTKLQNIEANLKAEEERLELTPDIEKELSSLYQEQMKTVSKHERMKEGLQQLERLKIEDPELYQELMESGDIEPEGDDSEISKTVREIKVKKHHEEMAEEYGEDMDWDEDRLEEFNARLSDRDMDPVQADTDSEGDESDISDNPRNAETEDGEENRDE